MNNNRICGLNFVELRNLVMDEIHKVPYAGHLRYLKTITAVRSQYFWPRMKRDIVEYITRYIECQRVKANHKHPRRLLQPFPILE